MCHVVLGVLCVAWSCSQLTLPRASLACHNMVQKKKTTEKGSSLTVWRARLMEHVLAYQILSDSLLDYERGV